MHRYAVLHDPTQETSVPIGLALERGDHVLVHVPAEYGTPPRYDGEYRVIGPDLVPISYRPGGPGYFDHVIIGLSTMFAIGHQGEVEHADDQTLLELYVRKVERPRERMLVGEYDPRLGYAREVADAPIRVAHGPQPLYRPEREQQLAIAARSRIVSA